MKEDGITKLWGLAKHLNSPLSPLSLSWYISKKNALYISQFCKITLSLVTYIQQVSHSVASLPKKHFGG